jgi:sugar lactone lactonase YvrE
MSKTPLSVLVSTERLRVRNLLVLLAVALVAACLAPALAVAGTAHELSSSFGRTGPGTKFEGGEFAAAATAVDSASHAVYVADLNAGTIDKFDENGNPVNFTEGPGAGTNKIGGFSFFAAEGFSEIAVDSATHIFYVAAGEGGAIKAFHEDGAPADFSAGPSVGGNEIASFGGNPYSLIPGVAVDANGDIYVGNYEAGVQIFRSDGEELTSFAISSPSNVAVDAHGTVYVSGYYAERPGVEKFTPAEFPVTASTTYSSGVVVTSTPVFAIAVDRSRNELYADQRLSFEPHESQIVQYDEAGGITSRFAGPKEPGPLSRSEGIAVDETTGNVYASDTQGQRQVEIFAPPPKVPPTVESTTATNVIATSADLLARVNPHLFDTRYHFEYLTEAEYQADGQTFLGAQTTPEADLGSSGETQTAHAHAGGLVPDTSYRFRVVTENENGETLSADPAPRVTTFAVLAPGLPDSRAYEMVSPTIKAGEVFAPEPQGNMGGSCFECLPGLNGVQMTPMQSTPDGEAVAYEGEPFFAGFSSGPNEYLSGRTASAWGTQSLSPAQFNNGGVEGQGYRSFSTDLSRSVLYQAEPVLSPKAPTREGRGFPNLYLRAEGGSLQPLVTAEPPERQPGTASATNFRLVYAAGNSGTGVVPALDHLVFEANDALTEVVPGVAPKAPKIEAGQQCLTPGENCNLYEWSAGQLHLVNVLPGNAVAATGAVAGSGRQLAKGDFQAPDVDHAISADGARIFWSSASGQVYVRINGETTEELKHHTGRFLTASTDGFEVLLSDGCLYDLEEEACVDDLAQGEGEKFEGILGAAEDLSRIYFVDTAVLTGEEDNANKEQAEEGEPNLYAWHEGTTRFIGTLLGSTQGDNEFGSNFRFGAWKAARPNRAAQVTPDGRYLAFMSKAPLTGYDNHLSDGGECRINEPRAPACPEVFEYQAETASLTCVSCNPTGQRPRGQSNLSIVKGNNGFPPLPQEGNLSVDGHGRLFFESQDILSPHDTNGHIQDVYEWEPNGIGSCKRGGGCIFLISSGNSPNDSMFVDSSASGNDAFFITRQQLLPRDIDDQLDLYDARAPHTPGEQVAFREPEEEAAPCGGEACRGPISTPPAPSAPSSSLFSGLGNVASAIVAPAQPVKPKPLTRAQKLAKALKACANKPKRKRRTCRAQARKRYGHIAKATSKAGAHKGGK